MVRPSDFWIYGRAEAEHSPRRQAGYQTLWRSSGVTPAMIEKLEAATRCFRLDAGPAQAASRRIQLCRLSDNAFAVTTTAAQTPDLAVDSGGRPTFVCGGLVFARAAVTASDFDPFAISAAISSGLDFAGLRARLGPPGAVREVTAFWQPPSSAPRPGGPPRPPSPGAQALLEWALDPEAPEILEEPVLLFGANGIESLLAETFGLLPPSSRPRFTFSTAMDGCAEPTRSFNLLATTRAAHHPRRAKVDSATAKWLAGAPHLSDSARRFLAFQHQQADCTESAWQAELSLLGKAADGAVDMRVVGAYLAAHAAEAAARIDRDLGRLPAGLRRSFCAHLLARAASDPDGCRQVFDAFRSSGRLGLEGELLAWAGRRGWTRELLVRTLLAFFYRR